MNRYICFHGHFYQPPRENPWLDEVELQDSAHPFHDWNERIAAECYGPNAASRILDDGGSIEDIVNNYAKISFNFGPTLLSWMQRHQPVMLEAIVEADAQSLTLFQGHGAAIAQVYNHMIMPLANERDKRTQVLWGLEDFYKRFGRDPEGMWLPEAAVDLRTLDILAQNGILYTILAPRQAAQARRIGEEEWRDVSGGNVDPTAPYLCSLPSGREIVLFFYDGPISQELAFADLLTSGEAFKGRLMQAFTDDGRDWPQLVHVATDGETYGHHHKHGEMALSWALRLIEEDSAVTLTNYGAYLAANPPAFEVQIHDNSSWSCIHGVERWREACGCNSGMKSGWTQEWRKPLREAMNWLSSQCADIYEAKGEAYFADPWKARDEYIHVIMDRSAESVAGFLKKHRAAKAPADDLTTPVKLLEMQRFAQLIFTSCGWFFDEVSGIETVQIIQYAVRAIQLAEELSGQFLEKKYAAMLEEAPSNVFTNGKEVFERFAKPARVDLLRVAAHYAVTTYFSDDPDDWDVASFEVTREIYHKELAGVAGLATGKARIVSLLTRESATIQFAVIHYGDHNLTCGVTFFQDLESYREMEQVLGQAFERGDITEAVRRMDDFFGKHTYSIWHLFRDAQRRVVDKVLTSAYEQAEASYRDIYDRNYPILNFLEWLNIPLPHHFLDAAAYVVNTDLKRLFSQERIEPEKLRHCIEEANKWNLDLERGMLGYLAAEWVNARMDELQKNPEDNEMLSNLCQAMDHLRMLPLGLHLWRAQNIFFSLSRNELLQWRQKADNGDVEAASRLECCGRLADFLKVKMP